jgi:hypothetical protein
VNLTELQTRAHQTAVEKGWHDSDEIETDQLGITSRITARQKLAWLALVTDELDEAACEEEAFYYVAGSDKPEGYLVEIVDALIRILDMAGALGIDVVGRISPDDNMHDYDIPRERMNLASAIRCGTSTVEPGCLVALFLAIQAEFSRRLGDTTDDSHIPTLEAMIELKDAHNQTRPHRHGGKLA